MNDERQTVAPGDAAALEPEHLTDLGNARRLVRQFGEDIRYVPSTKAIHLWAGTHWPPDDTLQIDRYAKNVAEDLYREAGYEDDAQRRKQLARHAMQSESARAIRAMIELAKSERSIVLPAAALDRNPWLLNCRNGTIDLRTGDLREHRREDLITKLISVDYDPTATAALFQRFLWQMLGGKPVLVRFVQKAIGYALTGFTSEQVLFILWGTGANGKSTLIQTIRTLLAGYAGTLAAESLLAKKGDPSSQAMNDLFSVRDTRFLAVAESDMGRRLAESVVKQVTGGESVKVKKLYSDLFEIDVQFKLFLSTNHRPVIRGVDHAIWRRIRLIPFGVVIPDDQQDHGLLEKLQAERPGILRWAVEGCLAWQREGLGTPDEVRAATKAYRDEMDILGDFLSERCVVDVFESVTAADLYTAYADWTKKAGEAHCLTKKALGLQLGERGFTKHRLGGERGWLGLRLRTLTDPVTEDASEDVTRFTPGFGQLSLTRVNGGDSLKTRLDASTRLDPSGAELPF
jgi:putative DNA primase/helicase